MSHSRVPDHIVEDTGINSAVNLPPWVLSCSPSGKTTNMEHPRGYSHALKTEKGEEELCISPTEYNKDQCDIWIDSSYTSSSRKTAIDWSLIAKLLFSKLKPRLWANFSLRAMKIPPEGSHALELETPSGTTPVIETPSGKTPVIEIPSGPTAVVEMPSRPTPVAEIPSESAPCLQLMTFSEPTQIILKRNIRKNSALKKGSEAMLITCTLSGDPNFYLEVEYKHTIRKGSPRQPTVQAILKEYNNTIQTGDRPDCHKFAVEGRFIIHELSSIVSIATRSNTWHFLLEHPSSPTVLESKFTDYSKLKAVEEGKSVKKGKPVEEGKPAEEGKPKDPKQSFRGLNSMEECETVDVKQQLIGKICVERGWNFAKAEVQAKGCEQVLIWVPR